MRNIHKLFKAVVFVFGMLLFAGSIAEAQVAVSLPNVTGPLNVVKDVPLTVGSLAGQNVKSFQFTLTYDQTAVNIDTVVYTAGMIADPINGSITVNTTVPGKITVAAAGASALTGSGALLSFKMKPLKVGNWPLTLTAFQFNEGVPAATITSGMFSIPAVSFFINDTTAKVAAGGALSIPIMTDDLASFNVRAWVLTITFDPALVSITDFSTAGTLSEGWSVEKNTTVAGKITLSGGNAVKMSGKGKLINLVGTAVANGKAVLAFSNVMLNEGTPVIGTLDGTVTVVINVKPVFTKVLNDTTIAENQALAFTYTATDANSDVVKYALIAPVTGMKIDSLTGAFTWTPTFAQSGSYNVIVKATDPLGLFSQDTATVTVSNLNRKPTFTKSLKDTTIAENQALAYTYIASDPDSTAVTYSLVGTVPAGATINATTGAFAWTPTYAQSGVYTIVVKATDPSGAFDSVSAKVTVTDVNRKPVLAVKAPAQKIDSVTFSTNIYFKTTATDPDGDVITYTWKLNGTQIKSGADSLYTGNFPTIGSTQNVVCVFADAKGLKDSATWSFKVVLKNTTPVDPMYTGVPTEFMVGQNYPNPFNPSTTIKFGLPKAAPVTLEIYNILGAKVRTLLSGSMMDASYHNVVWDGRSDAGSQVASGMYLYRLVAGTHVSTMKMLLMK